MARVCKAGLATYHELKTIYSYEDLMRLDEIVEVDRINERRVAKYIADRRSRRGA